MRIYPVLILMFITVICIQQPNLTSPIFLQRLVGNLLMLQDFKSGKPHVIVAPLFSSALWSLHYQWWHYMLYYPVNHRFRKQDQGRMVGAVALLCTVLYCFHANAVLRILIYFPVWWAGVEMARSFLKHQTVRPRDMMASALFLGAIASLLLLNAGVFIAQGNLYSFGIHPILEVRHFIAAILTLGISLIWQHYQWLGFGILKFGTRFAPISYSLYIAHQPLLAQSQYLGFIDNVVLEKTLYLIVLLTFCYVAEVKLSPFLSKKLQRTPTRIRPARAVSK
ncbi:MAG: acyltransferase [Leptolyngbya sp. RL_3_1]|nr:acyltransferase [Leptolyngbya sp. RL_3_1]